MKPLEEIENISPDRLEKIAADTGIPVPEGLGDELRETVAAAALAADKADRKALPWMRFGIPAGIAAAALAAFLLLPSRAPKDTFDDPRLAYAELEKTFAYISRKMDVGLSIANKANEPIETVNQAINKTK